MIQIKNITKMFNKVSVFENLSINIAKGDYMAITGPSGSGKSTLLYSMSGMDRVDNGQILFNGKEITEMTDKELATMRLIHMGFVFQNPQMLKNLSILDNIMLPGLVAGVEPASTIRERALHLMKKMDIETIQDRDIKEVSGGQLQRASICRAMINHPKVLFMDEPTGALNREATIQVLEILKELNAEGMTIIVVTHDEQVASQAKKRFQFSNKAF